MDCKVDFSSAELDLTELYVVLGSGKTPEMAMVPIDDSVRCELAKALTATVEMLSASTFTEYDPSNDYPAESSVYAHHADLLPVVKHLYLHEDMAWNELADKVSGLLSASAYVAKFCDASGKRISAVRKVSGMQHTLTKKRMASIRGGALKIDDTQRFEIHDRFDFLVDDSVVNIRNVVAFEGVCLLNKAISEAAHENLQHLSSALEFVDFTVFQSKASSSKRVARELASIRSKGYATGISRTKLEEKCRNASISFRDVNGKLVIDDEMTITFIKIIGRKVLEADLSTDGVEVYSVSSRNPFG